MVTERVKEERNRKGWVGKWRERVSSRSRGGKLVDISLHLAPLIPIVVFRSLTSTQMAEIETLGILMDIESLVTDKLQVVTTLLPSLFLQILVSFPLVSWSQTTTLIF